MADLGRRLVQLQRHLLETLEPPQQRQLQHTIEHSSAHLEAMDLRAWSARQR